MIRIWTTSHTGLFYMNALRGGHTHILTLWAEVRNFKKPIAHKPLTGTCLV